MTHSMTLSTNRKKTAIQNITMVLCFLLCLSVFVLSSIDVAFCTSNNSTASAITAISDAVVMMTSSIYGFILSIITPAAVCCFAIAGCMFFLGGKNGTEKARVLAISGIAGILIVVFAPLIASEVASWVSPFANHDLSKFNPF